MITPQVLILACMFAHVWSKYTCETPPETVPNIPLIFPLPYSQAKLYVQVTSNAAPTPGEENKIFRPEKPSQQLWPNGIVKYQVDSVLRDNTNLLWALNEFHSKTCVRFKPCLFEKNYVVITGNDTGIECGRASVCMRGGKQVAKFNHSNANCVSKATFVHELAHTLCLSHEHWRDDRNDYVSFDTCTYNDTGTEVYQYTGIYDYASQMHYQCTCAGKGGIPTTQNWTRCGDQIPGNEGLSVMDAENINELYNCQGCHRHRWRNMVDLEDKDLQNMYNFGYSDNLGRFLYPCRALVDGEVAVGEYIHELKECKIPSRFRNATVVVNSSKAEVLTIPGGLSVCSGEGGHKIYEYGLASVLSETVESIVNYAVPAGNGWSLDEQEFTNSYIAFASFPLEIKDVKKEFGETVDKVGGAWHWKGKLKFEKVFPMEDGSIGSYKFVKILTCRPRDTRLESEEGKPWTPDESTERPDCAEGCFRDFDGTCVCSVFDDY